MELDEKPLISVIVPVYNVEKYVRKCLDSILNQTYENLEILIIDDGSTDGSSSICDEYKKDERIRVYHTDNHGLSAARNLGLDHATGQYIGFVDSDDWIEPDMYEVLVDKALETGADVVECGIFLKYPERTERHKRRDAVLTGTEAIQALLNEELSENAWNKLWRKDCFDTIRFPEGRIFEDIATTYKVYKNIKSICSLTAELYHYNQRANSLSHQHNMKNLIDFWLAHYERYEALKVSANENTIRRLLYYCALATARTWAYYSDCGTEERVSNHDEIKKMNDFTRQNIPLFGYRGWGLKLRLGVFFSHYFNTLSFRVAKVMNRIGSSCVCGAI